VGFRILRPETVPIEEQLRAYAGAESLFFAEGSALHTPQLMGRALGDVTVLLRRDWGGYVMAQATLSPRCRSLHSIDVSRGLVHGLAMGRQPWPEAGLCILEPEKLLTALPIGDLWDQEAFDRAVKADVETWLQIERASPRWSLPGSQELVGQSLREAGLA
jgi:hypothetical protein